MDKVGTREERIRGRWAVFEGRSLPRKSGKTWKSDNYDKNMITAVMATMLQ